VARLLLAAVPACVQAGEAPQGVSPGTAAAPAAIQDLLDVRAVKSARAAGQLMLSVARAGTRLVAVGERGFIVWSDDEGARWQQAQVPVSVTLTAVSFPTPQQGWAVGHGGVILHSEDGGVTWKRQFDGRSLARVAQDALKTLPADREDRRDGLQRDVVRLQTEGATRPLLDVHFENERNGLVVGAYGVVLSTRDGGVTWQARMADVPNTKGMHLYAIAVQDRTWWLVGEQGSIFRATDGGLRFERVASPYAGSFFGVLPGPGSQVLVYGLRGNALCSQDGGATWQPYPVGSPATLTHALRLADGRVALADEAGRVIVGDGCRTAQPPRQVQPLPITHLLQSAQGRLLATGVMGVRPLPKDFNDLRSAR